MLIRYTHAGLCHSDVHVAHGDLEARLPMVLGHEGAGIIEEVGPGRDPGRGRATTSSARSSRTAASAATAPPASSRSATWARRSSRATCPASASRSPDRAASTARCACSARSASTASIHQNSCVKVDDDLPLDKAVLVGCGVPTGWGSAVNTAERPARRHRGDLRHRRHRHQRGAGRPATPARRTSSPSTRWRTSARRRWSSARRTRSPRAEEAQAAITELTRGADGRRGDPHRRPDDRRGRRRAAFNAVGKGGIVVRHRAEQARWSRPSSCPARS